MRRETNAIISRKGKKKKRKKVENVGMGSHSTTAGVITYFAKTDLYDSRSRL